MNVCDMHGPDPCARCSSVSVGCWTCIHATDAARASRSCQWAPTVEEYAKLAAKLADVEAALRWVADDDAIWYPVGPATLRLIDEHHASGVVDSVAVLLSAWREATKGGAK